MCLQAEIFKYSNLIKTKKNSKHKTRKLSIFLIRYYRWREYFWVLFFVSVLNGTWGVEFSCETVNCCLIEMSNIPSQNPVFQFVMESWTHQMNRMQGKYTSNKITSYILQGTLLWSMQGTKAQDNPGRTNILWKFRRCR